MLHTVKLNDPVTELRRFGFDRLTGEACGVGHRTLFDTDERAKKIWEGMTRTKITQPAWNKTGKDVGSVMIPYGWYTDLLLWCLLIGTNCHTVIWLDRLVNSPEPVKLPYMLIGIDAESSETELGDEVDKQTRRGYAIRRYFRQSKAPGTGLDNRHMMSGRTI